MVTKGLQEGTLIARVGSNALVAKEDASDMPKGIFLLGTFQKEH